MNNQKIYLKHDTYNSYNRAKSENNGSLAREKVFDQEALRQ